MENIVIDTNNLINFLIAAIFGNTMVMAAIGYIFKSIFSNRLERSIIEYQSKLEMKRLEIEFEAKEKITEYQSKLEIERISHQISYGGIFEKQADAIIDIYHSLLNFDRSLYLAMQFPGADQSYHEKFLNSWRELSKKIEDSRIFMPDSVTTKFKEIEEDIFSVVDIHRRDTIRLDKNNLPLQEIEKIFARQDRNYSKVNQMPELKQELVESLRSLIGVKNSTSI